MGRHQLFNILICEWWNMDVNILNLNVKQINQTGGIYL